MRKIAKFLSSVLAAAMLLGMCSFTSSAAFKDVSAKDEALYQAVTLLNSLGIAKGTSDTTFGTSKKVTREQMAAFIYRLMKEGKSVEGGENITTFTDLKDPTFYYMISWASKNNIIKGRSETVFDPSGDIILQDCYVMLARALGYEKDETLNYPYGFIDVAERIGLDKNLDSKVTYDSVLTRGDVAIILYNAFYAEMNETYRKAVSPALEKPGQDAAAGFIYVEEKETVSHKIYNVEEVYRRVIATPSYALDISEIGNGSEYKAYAPLGGEKADKDLIQTAAIVPDEDSTRLANEEAVLEFADLGLSGKADDYFLSDLVMYMKKDGTIVGVNAIGKKASNVGASIQTCSGTNSVLDYTYNSSGQSEYNARKPGDKKLRTGLVTFGKDNAYFYNKPSNVPDYTYSIYLADGDGEGRVTYKAGYNWYGKKLDIDYNVSMKDTSADAGKTRTQNHRNISYILSTMVVNGKYSMKYFDCNSDGYIDYICVMPFTWGKIVDKKGSSYTVDAKHTGDSAYRAYFNNSKKIPEIYVGDAYVEGGAHPDGKYVFAYVSGPAKYIVVAPDETNNAVRHVTTRCIRHDSDHNTTWWQDGSTIYAWNSGNTIVGHTYGKTSVTGLVGLGSDLGNDEAFADNWRSSVQVDSTWEMYLDGGRVLMATRKESTTDVAKQYAVVQYVNEDEKQVVFRAGGVQTDGTLETDEYVHAYVDGQYQIVKQAKKTKDGTRQNDNYYVDNGMVGSVSTYTVNGDGEYMFEPVKLTANAADLDGDDETATYGVEVSNISLEKYRDKIYRFVPNGSTVLPSSLSPNGMRYVAINDATKILVRYINSDDESDYTIYSASRLPDFNAKDESMRFTKAVVILKNRTDSTTTEYLAFMYCEIGGDVINDDENEKYRLLLGNEQVVNDKNQTVYRYDTVDPMTGEKYTSVETTKTSSNELDNFALYKIDGDGKIMNTSSGLKAKLGSDSSDLLTLASYEPEAKLIVTEGSSEPVLVKDSTVFALLDREESVYTIEEEEMLSIEADDDTDNEYYTPGETQLKIYMITDKESGDDFRYAKLVIVVRDKA